MESLVNEPKTSRGKKTFDKICNEADELFYTKGYHETSVTDITSRADVAAGTFYIYFKDKITLYKYLLLRYSHEIRKTIRSATKHCHSRAESEKAGLKAFLEYIKDKPRAYNIIWTSLYIDNKLFIEYYEDFAKRYEKGILTAQANDEMAQGDPILIAYMLMGVVNFIGLKYGVFDRTENIDEIVDTAMRILTEGIFKTN